MQSIVPLTVGVLIGVFGLVMALYLFVRGVRESLPKVEDPQGSENTPSVIVYVEADRVPVATNPVYGRLPKLDPNKK